MIPPGFKIPGDEPSRPSGKAQKPKPGKAKGGCRCEPTPAAKKAAAAKKTAKAAARKVPRASKTATKAAKKKSRIVNVGRLDLNPHGATSTGRRAGVTAKGHSAATTPPTHGKAETHCQCKKTSTPRARRTTPRR